MKRSSKALISAVALAVVTLSVLLGAFLLLPK